METYSRYRNQKGKQDQEDNTDLVIIGYACNIFPNDERADSIAEERHLQSWNGDGSIRIDRYDVRLLLSSIDDRTPGRDGDEEECSSERLEEDMCNEERYKDMFVDISRQAVIEEESRRKKAEIAFDYGSTGSPIVPVKEEAESDSEDEPFEPPPGIKLPVGLTLPDNQKQNHIIERTAMFVVTKGPQMEIVIKAKQRNNAEQFGFLDFDNVLNPYYKYISKLIREKKYIPDFTKKASTKASSTDKAEKKDKKPLNALAALAVDHASDSDSDSDYELHPSLFAKKRSRSPDIVEQNNASGPKQRPVSPPPEEVSAIRKDYDMSKSNDSYANLFKSLSQAVTGKPYLEKREDSATPPSQPVATSSPRPAPVSNTPATTSTKPTSNIVPDVEWQQWWLSFYGTPAPRPTPLPLVPPPPDLEPIVANYANFVARHGSETEASLLARPDLQLNFMHPHSVHFSYYQHKVRMAQWEIFHGSAEQRCSSSPAPSSPSVATQEAAPLNRKQRRRLQDAEKVGPAPPPGVIDPISLKIPTIEKVKSLPTIIESPKEDLKPFQPTGPVSFTIGSQKEEARLSQSKDLVDDPLEAMVDSPSDEPATSTVSDVASVLGVVPPVPPSIPNNTQLDRKEKARIFMEKLMNEKRAKKMQDLEMERIKALEKQKEKLEKELACTTEEITVFQTADSDTDDTKSGNKDNGKEKATGALDLIDNLINDRINNILVSNGLDVPRRDDDSDDGAKKSKRKKEKRKRRHEDSYSKRRSRSRSRDRRSRSRSRERRRRRSNSSDREYESRKKYR